jgi:hypothetical protein
LHSEIKNQASRIMTFKADCKKVQELLSTAPGKRTYRERLMVVTQVKILVEMMQAEIKKRTDKERAANDKRTQIIKKALRELVRGLDRIFEKHEEIGDTAVREEMFMAIHNGFIKPAKSYKLPAKYGMFSEEGNALVHGALRKFLAHPEVLAARKRLCSPEDRLHAFQDSDVETSEGTNIFEYFGSRNKPMA